MKKFGFDNLLVSDREIFDAIYSQKQKLPDDKLLNICKNMGLFISTNENRETLCQYISTQFKDWHSLKVILDNLFYNEKSKKTSSLLMSGVSLADFKDVIKELAPQFSDNQMSHKGVGVNKYEVSLTTSTIERSNTRLIQKPLTDQTISVEQNGSDVVFRFDSDEVLDPIISKIIEKVAGTNHTTFKQKEISLTVIEMSEYRTNFFLNLIVMDEKNYFLHDVKKIKVHHNSKNSTMEIEPDDLASPKDSGFLKTAHLSGSSLHTNNLYQGLRKLGHYITEITWIIEDKKGKKLIEINAGFQNPKECSRFFYDIKGTYKLNTKGIEYTLERHKILDTEKSDFLKFFDKFLYETYDNVINDYNSQLVRDDE